MQRDQPPAWYKTGLMDNQADRQQQLSQWTDQALNQLLTGKNETIVLDTVSGDASFRRYFRARIGGQSFIAVDAPPQHEDNRRYVDISNRLREAGVCAPRVYAVDYDRGFMLLEDFGDRLYLETLLNCQRQQDFNTVDTLYRKAIDAMVLLQSGLDKKRLDPYDRSELQREMSLFDEWFCGQLLGMTLDRPAAELIQRTYSMLADSALAQQQVAVHRDFHSRNLMLLDADKFADKAGPGVIDFQDAVSGAYSYDLVSLLRDCYIRWSPQQIRQWSRYYLEQALAAAIVTDLSPDQLQRDFDYMGLQRHLKVMGIFARLSIRDNKSAYLADIPLVIDYFLEVSESYPELAEFVAWFREKVLPLTHSRLELDT
jgi:N-acetylmuramate 1-kinase